MQDQLKPHLKVCGLKYQESFVAVFAVYNRFEQKKTKIKIQIRDLHCLLGLVFGVTFSSKVLVLVSAFFSTVDFVKVAKPVDKSNRKMRQVWKSWLLCQSEKSRATPEIFVATEVIRQLAALIWQLRAAVFCSIAEQWSNNAKESNCMLLSPCTVLCSTTEHWSNKAELPDVWQTSA